MVKISGDANHSKSSRTRRRRPLRDVSNSIIKPLNSTNTKKKMTMMNNLLKDQKLLPQIQHSNNNNVEEDPLDRLLLVHSDISSLLRQIDEFVVQAVNVKPTDHERIKEIKSFTAVLSDIHSSLKPWVPRLQKTLAVSHTESDIQSCETCVGGLSVADQDEAHSVDTPEPTKHELLVSPSPLVSWRAIDYAEETGKQLFLLTPLMRPGATTSRAHATSSKLTPCEEITSSPVAVFPAPCANEKSNNGNNEVVSNNPEYNLDMGFVSALKILDGDFSTSLITPCLSKLSLKTCVMHEPGHDLPSRKTAKSHKSTPFPIRNKNVCELTDSESSSEATEKLGLKYPELIGIKPSYISKKESRALESSPAWMMSPPKCCTLLEPLDEKQPKGGASLQDLASTFSQQMCLAPTESNTNNYNQDIENKKFCLQGPIRSQLAVVESTPLWKGLESTIQKGKRPGENTLKRELWTQFEAASTNGCRLNSSVFEDNSHKQFLERLEEASCDVSTVDADELR